MIMDAIITSVSRHIDDPEKRIDIYYDMMTVLQSMGCDTLDECQGLDPAFDHIFYVNTFVDEFKNLTNCDEEVALKMAHVSYYKYDKNARDDASKEAIMFDGTVPDDSDIDDDDDWYLW